MKRLTLALAFAVAAAALAPNAARADGINVARFLAHNRVAAKKRTRFDQAFQRLRKLSKAQASTRGILLARSKSSRSFFGTDKRIESSSTLTMRGGRLYMTLTTSSEALRPSTSTSTVRVHTGRLLGWYGKMLLRAQFPDLTVKQIERALGDAGQSKGRAAK